MSTAEMAQAATPGRPRLRQARAISSASRGISAGVAAVHHRRELILDHIDRPGPRVGPAEPLVVAVGDGDDDHGGGVPGQRAIGFGLVGGDGVGAGCDVSDGHPGLCRECHPVRDSVMRWSAQRAARAMIVNAGLAEPWVGSTLPSVI